MEGSIPTGSTLVSQYSDSESESEERELSHNTRKSEEYMPNSTANSTQALSESNQEASISASSDDSERDSTSADDGYNSRSQSLEQTGSEDTSEETRERAMGNRRTTLSNPFSSVVTDTTAVFGTESVFNVPFRTSEDIQSTLLQHHVKLTPNHKQQSKLNGKKICWSHRKGKCRFGHKCTFAHDTDLSLSQEDGTNTDAASQGDPATKNLTVSQSTNLVEGAGDTEFEPNRRAKKRPGLSQTLIPGKKVMSQYYRT